MPPWLLSDLLGACTCKYNAMQCEKWRGMERLITIILPKLQIFVRVWDRQCVNFYTCSCTNCWLLSVEWLQTLVIVTGEEQHQSWSRWPSAFKGWCPPINSSLILHEMFSFSLFVPQRSHSSLHRTQFETSRGVPSNYRIIRRPSDKLPYFTVPPVLSGLVNSYQIWIVTIQKTTRWQQRDTLLPSSGLLDF